MLKDIEIKYAQLFILRGWYNTLRDTVKDSEKHRRIPAEAISHACWMLKNMPDYDSDPEKFNRWVGFIQGILWMTGEASINELRDDITEVTGPRVPDQHLDVDCDS